jgi:tyrosine-protein phosphatase SIW14
MRRYLQYFFAALIVLLLVGGPFAYGRYRHNRWRNFHVVRDGVLYRSGQISLDGLKQIVYDYQIKTVITLRDAAQPGDPPPDRDQEEWCIKEEINFVRIPPRAWEAADGSVPAAKGIAVFNEVMQNPANYPVLIHCLAGKHRTGAYCAAFRMEHDKWTNEQAIEEMKLYGYDNVQEHLDLLAYLDGYRPTWKKEENTPPGDSGEMRLAPAVRAAPPHVRRLGKHHATK